MTVLKDSPGAGHFILSEANGYRSRQRIVVGLSQTLLAGQVLGKVTASGDYVKLAPSATDGSQTAAGIAFDDYVTTTEKVDGVSFERDGEVIAAEEDAVKRAGLVAALDRLPALHAAQRDRVIRDNAGPYAAWREHQMTGPQTQEWLHGEALDALDGMNKGLMDAWKNADGAGDALMRMGRAGIDALGRIKDALLEVAIQQMFIQPLTNALFGGGKASGGGFIGNLMNNIMGSAGLGGSGKTPIKAGKARGGLNPSRGLVPVGEYGLELMDMPAGARIYDTERTERMLRDATSAGGRGGAVLQPTFNMPVTVVNNGSEKLQATTRRSPEGIDVILEPLVRKAVGKMGADGSLARSYRQTPKGKDR